MKNEFKLKTCTKCGAVVEVMKDCTCDDCGIKCCGEEMVEMKPNTADASAEKHLPSYEVIGQYIVASVNHVMEDEHYIEYLALDHNNLTAKKFFKPNEKPTAVFPYIEGSKLYAYCNKHGVWQTTINK